MVERGKREMKREAEKERVNWLAADAASVEPSCLRGSQSVIQVYGYGGTHPAVTGPS